MTAGKLSLYFSGRATSLDLAIAHMKAVFVMQVLFTGMFRGHSDGLTM